MDAFVRNGVPPASEGDLPGFQSSAPRQRYIGNLTIEHGRIEIRFGENADETLRGQSLSVSPFESMDGDVSWLCGDRTPGVGLYPLGLFGGTPLPGRPLTTIEQRYLPSECR